MTLPPAAARTLRAGLATTLLLAGTRFAPGAGQSDARLTFSPLGAPVGGAVTARAIGLLPDARFALVWHTGRASWRVAHGDFFGIIAPDTAHILTTATSDGRGALSVRFRVPEDFGYLHDVDLRASSGEHLGPVAAEEGFTVVPRLTISPTSGPAGTPITVTMTGGGYRFYQVVWHLLYDGAQTGWLSGITTHGTARVTIPATGTPGIHTLQALEGPTAPYLNVEQSPNYQPLVPTVIAQRFRLTAGPPRTPRPAAAQSLPRKPGVLDPPGAGPSLSADFRSGTVGSPLILRGAGFAPDAPIALVWETVIGNRLSGNGWEHVRRPFASTISDAGGRFVVRVHTPSDLGGPHRVIARAAGGPAGTDAASFTYTITPSVAEITPRVVRPGGAITVHLRGVGWTETANTYTMDVDDAFTGYGCGFNSQGDVTITLRAPGPAGMHYVDLWPTIYRGHILGPGAPPLGADVNGSYLLLPMLNLRDHPGERLPAFHLAFEVRGR